MKIAVLLKPVPTSLGEIMFADDSGNMERQNISHAFAGLDCEALNQALSFKKMGKAQSVSVFSMTPPSNEKLLIELKNYGVDFIYHISDPLFAGSDSLCTARVLAEAIKKKGPFDLVLAGKRSLDSETGQVPAETAHFLGLPFASSITGMEIQENTMTVFRQLEDRSERIVIPLPCALSICTSKSALNPPSLDSMRQAGRSVFEKIDHFHISIKPSQIGKEGSPTYVEKLYRMDLPRRKHDFITDPREGAKAIVKEIRSALESKFPHKAGGTEQFDFPDASVNLVACPLFDIAGFENALELIAFLSAHKGNPITIALGRCIDNDSKKKIRMAGASGCVFMEVADTPDERVYAKAIAGMALDADSVLFPASIRMTAIAPICAAMLSVGLTADCTDLRCADDGSLVQIRPTFGGTLLAHVKTKTRPAMATVRAGTFSYALTTAAPAGDYVIEKRTLDDIGQFRKISERLFEKSDWQDGGDVIFSVGAGLDAKQADKVSALGFRIGASRVAVNRNLSPYSCQVGQTGRTVRPKLYVAFGISGAVQHLAGMKDSRRIVAVNTDCKAPIFNCCDIAICAKADDVINELEKIKKEEGFYES